MFVMYARSPTTR